MAFCTNCGKALEENEKFCSDCGTPTKTGSPKPPPKKEPEKPKYTKEGRKIIDAGPKPNQNKYTPPRPRVSSTKKKKKRGFAGCLISALIIIAILAAGFFFIMNFASDWFNELSLGITSNEQTEEQKIAIDSSEKPVNELTKTVSEKNPVAGFEKVEINFGQFNIDNETDVSLQEYPEQVIDGECKIVSYEIKTNNRNQFDDVVTISLPYDESFIENGNAEKCVAAQYYNEDSKTWEPVVYEIDTKNKRVKIQTNHFSRYGVFTVKNTEKRYAYITNVYIPDRYIRSYQNGMHLNVLENYYENNRSLGKEALDFGLSFWSEFSGKSGVALNTLTAGGSYSTKFTESLNNGFKNLGYAASLTQLGYDLCYSDEKTTAINFTKNVMNQLVAEFATPAINIAFIGVYFIDVALTDFGNAMLAQKYKELFEVYDYYNRNYNERTLKEWRSLMIEIHKDHPDDPEEAYRKIMDEIEDYAWKFMETTNIGKENENTEELNALAGEAGLRRMSWPSENDIEGVYGEAKQKIIDKLYPVFTSVNNWRFYRLKLELTKEASLLAAEMNKKVNLTITENLGKGEDAKYGGYTVAIRPLGKGVDTKNWTGKLKSSGITKTSFTFIGHHTAGMPNVVEIYKPDDQPDEDKPVISKKFIVDESREIIIELGETPNSKWVLFDQEVIDKSQYFMVKHDAAINNGSLKASCVSPDPSSNSFSHYSMSAQWTPFKNSYMEGESVRTKASVSFDGKNVSNSVLFILFQTAMNDAEPTDFNGRSEHAGIDGELTYTDGNGRETDKAEFSTIAPRALSKDDVWVISVYGEGSEYKMFYKPQQVGN